MTNARLKALHEKIEAEMTEEKFDLEKLAAEHCDQFFWTEHSQDMGEDAFKAGYQKARELYELEKKQVAQAAFEAGRVSMFKSDSPDEAVQFANYWASLEKEGEG